LAGWLCALVLACCCVPRGMSQYIEAEDTELAAQAAAMKADVCGSLEDQEVDQEAGREGLQSLMGGSNIVLEAILASKSADDTTDAIVEDVVDPGFIISIGYPILLAILTLLLYVILCYTSYPCYKCCRCCCRPKEPAKHTVKAKVVCLLLLCVSVIGIIVGGSLAIAASSKAVSGFDHVTCTAATMTDTIMSGSTSAPTFIGLIPMFRAIEGVDNSLDDNSDMMTEFWSILDKTQSIADVNTLLAEILDALSSNIGHASNTNPSDTAGSLYHECTTLQTLTDPLDAARDSLKGSVGEAIVNARSSAEEAMNSRADIQTSLRSAADAMKDFKKQIRSLKAFVDPDGFFYAVREQLGSQAMVSSLMYTFGAITVLMFGFCAMGVYFVKEVNKADNNLVDDDIPRFNKTPHRIACCAWSCACLPISSGCILAGLMLVIAAPIACMCDIMDKLSEDLLTQMSAGLDMELPESGGFSIQQLIGTCLAPDDPSLNANMLDLVMTSNGTEQVTTRAYLEATITAPLDLAFDTLATAMDSSTTMAGNSQFTSLVQFFEETPFSSTCIPAFSDNSVVDATVLLGDDDLKTALETSMSCPDVTPDINGTTTATISGIDSLNTKMANVSTGSVATSTTTTCLKEWTCDPASGRAAACAEAKKVIALKERLAQPGIFKCKRFVDAFGAPCDPKDMVYNTVTKTWSSDCMFTQAGSSTDGWQTEEASCTIVELEDTITNLAAALTKTLERFDIEVQNAGNVINVDLRALCYAYIVTPVLSIIDGIRCGFMAQTWDGIINGLCFEGVVAFGDMGKSYFVTSVFLVYMALVLYSFWRMSIDNVNLEAKRRHELAKIHAVPSS